MTNEDERTATPGQTPDTPSGKGTVPQGRIVRRTALALAALVLAIFTAEAAHRAMDIVRGTPVQGLLVTDGGVGGGLPPVTSPEFARLVGALAEAPLQDGNAVQVLTDAATYDALLRDLDGASASITLLLYFCEPGLLADRVMEVLAERARSGVDVRVVGDGFGCAPLLPRLEATLRPTGVQVATLRPIRWWALHRAQHRNHSRLVVVDGRVAYTGGFGLSDAWLTGEAQAPAWRDTNVRMEGPVVTPIQAAFAAAWAEATGQLPALPALFPPQAGGGDLVGDVRAGFLASGPGLGTSPAERYLALSIAGARRSLYVTNSYFVPPPVVRTLLVAAARRGVDVRVLVPGPRIDIPSTRWAGRSYYRELLEGGVRIWEYQPTMMHAKTLVVDGGWVGVGSLNLDNRSLRLNEESTALIQDAGVGATMDSLFLADLLDSKEILLPDHRARPLPGRVLEFLNRLVSPLL